MSEHEPDEPELLESPLDAREDARIRALLADARHTEAMPAEVVARLDRVLAGLATERAPVAPVVDLARRRRTAAKLLVAAAAVVVAGVGIGQVLPGVGGGTSTTDAEAPAAASQEDAQAGSGGDGGGTDRAPTPELDPSAPQAAAGDVARIREAHFGADVRLVRSRLGDDDAKGFSAAPDSGCLPAPVGEGTVLAVEYDGAAAALVLRPPAGDTQVVDLYLCGRTSPQRSITLTAP
jgi:hypothetical protein